MDDPKDLLPMVAYCAKFGRTSKSARIHSRCMEVWTDESSQAGEIVVQIGTYMQGWWVTVVAAIHTRHGS